ncbi:hypothetical protein VPH35_009747 [Triticum aestivum]
MRHVERRLKPEEFSAQLSFDVAEWCQFFTPSPKPVIQDTSKWKPSSEFVKINLDCAYYPESGTGGWGCMLERRTEISCSQPLDRSVTCLHCYRLKAMRF